MQWGIKSEPFRTVFGQLCTMRKILIEQDFQFDVEAWSSRFNVIWSLKDYVIAFYNLLDGLIRTITNYCALI